MGVSEGQIGKYATIILYIEAMMLGGNTVVGKGSVIGSNGMVTKNLPPNCKTTIRLRFNTERSWRYAVGLLCIYLVYLVFALLGSRNGRRGCWWNGIAPFNEHDKFANCKSYT